MKKLFTFLAVSFTALTLTGQAANATSYQEAAEDLTRAALSSIGHEKVSFQGIRQGGDMISNGVMDGLLAFSKDWHYGLIASVEKDDGTYYCEASVDYALNLTHVEDDDTRTNPIYSVSVGQCSQKMQIIGAYNMDQVGPIHVEKSYTPGEAQNIIGGDLP